MKAATYARYSSTNQRESSIEDQQRNCHARAKAEGWEVVEDFVDKAISGTDNTRPGYRAMQAAALRGGFDVLVVDDLARLTRDLAELETVIPRLEFKGIRIVSCADGYDSRSAARKIHRGMKGLINSVYLDDLADKVHRGQKGQALKGFWCGGRPYGYTLVEVRDPRAPQRHGREGRIGTKLEINENHAAIVRRIFESYAAGDSCLSIARALNDDTIPSPGSSWKRVKRRCSGWMTSSVRVILRNPLYTGVIRWNTNKIPQDPDTGRHVRRARPEKEWVIFRDEGLRIVSEALWDQCARRSRKLKDDDVRLKAGGKAKYPLSGLMVCGQCGAHFILQNASMYACSSVIHGAVCSHTSRVSRKLAEAAIIDPIKVQLRDPAQVVRMAREMELSWEKHISARAAQSKTAPRQIQELDKRIDRLRDRLISGDPELTADDLNAVIERLEGKRRELLSQPAVGGSARVLSLLPKAADLYLKQIERGLDGNPRASAKARLILRDLLGPISLSTDRDGRVWADYKLNPAALIRDSGTDGRGERI